MRTVISYSIILIVFFIVTLIKPVEVHMESSEKYYLNNGLNYNGRTLLPLRDIGESLNTTVVWKGETNSAIIRDGNREIQFTVGKKEVLVDSKQLKLDTEPINFQGRVYLPIRDIANLLNFDVIWDQENNRAILSSEKVEIYISVARNPVGNRIGNAKSVIHKDWIYYSNGQDNFRLYKCKLDGSNNQKVTNLPAYNINYYNDWIYFSTLNSNDNSEWETGGIYKIKENGTELTKLSDEITEKMFVSSKGIYFLTNGTKQNINRMGFGFYLVSMDFDGKNRRYINHNEKWIGIKGTEYSNQYSRAVGTLDVVKDMALHDNFIIANTSNKIVKINLDTNKIEKIYTGVIDGAGDNGTLQIYYPNLYFSNKHELHQLNLTNNKVEKLAIPIVASTRYIVGSKYIYYAVRDKAESVLYRAEKGNTRNIQRITQFDPYGGTNIFYHLDIVGDNLFFNVLTLRDQSWTPSPYLLDKNSTNPKLIY